MCLLFQKPAATSFNDAQLADMYKRNSDGYGVMYAKGGVLYTNKGVGSLADWIAFFRAHEGEEACWHLRMRTHGDIDLENCHPYGVFGFEDGVEYSTPMALMHNGILRTGNDADRSKSDTWHYIRDYLRPMLASNPDFAFTKAFAEIVGSHIDGNKFAIMDHTGQVAIINRRSGFEWEGVWFSNTYAFSARDNTLYPGIHKEPVLSKWDNGNWKGSHWHGRDVNVGTPAPKQLSLAKELELEKDYPGLYGIATRDDIMPRLTKPTKVTRKKAKLLAHKSKTVTNVVPLGWKAPATSSMFDADVDHIRSIIAEDFPDAGKKISIPQVESALSKFGAQNVLLLIDECHDIAHTFGYEHAEQKMVEIFSDLAEAKLLLNVLTGAVN